MKRRQHWAAVGYPASALHPKIEVGGAIIGARVIRHVDEKNTVSFENPVNAAQELRRTVHMLDKSAHGHGIEGTSRKIGLFQRAATGIDTIGVDGALNKSLGYIDADGLDVGALANGKRLPMGVSADPDVHSAASSAAVSPDIGSRLTNPSASQATRIYGCTPWHLHRVRSAPSRPRGNARTWPGPQPV